MTGTDQDQRTDGSARGAVRVLLRLEALALLVAAVMLYAWHGGSWWLFAALFLIPDLSFAAYLAGPLIGSAVYNALHSTIGPVVLGIGGLWLASPVALSVALIWLAHIGFDRALGYGLKYAAGFGITHLGRFGKDAAQRQS